MPRPDKLLIFGQDGEGWRAGTGPYDASVLYPFVRRVLPSLISKLVAS